MRQTMESVASGMSVVARLALWTASIGLFAMTAVVAAQVFFRYVLNDSIVWSEPVALQIMSWFIFLGAAVGIREGYHLSFDVLLHFIPRRAKLVLHSISDLVVLGFGAGMFWYGLLLAQGTWNATIPSLGIPGGVEFLPLVAGGLLLVIFSLERLARRAAGLHTARFGDETGETA